MAELILFQTDAFHLTYTTEIYREKILTSANVCKATGIDDLPGRSLFSERWFTSLSKPISELCNVSNKLGSFLDSCKNAKLKSLFQKGSETKP